MSDQSTTQWQAILKSAGLPPDVPLAFEWSLCNKRLVNTLLNSANGRPIILVHGGREPMNRTDGFGLDLVPRREAFEAVLAEFEDCFRIRIGKAAEIYPLPCELDLNGNTSVADLLDIASVCQGVIAQCSFAVPMAEVFSKPLLAVWSKRGLTSKTLYLRHITPAKVLHRHHLGGSWAVMDEWPELHAPVTQWKSVNKIGQIREQKACIAS